MFSKKAQKYLLFIIVLMVIVIELPILLIGLTTKPIPSDVIIVLGAKLIHSEPSTMLKLRLDKGLALLHEGYAPMIMVSGAKGSDEEISEAVAMRQYLLQQGVSANNIIIEDNSYSTWQNLSNCKMLMNDYGFHSAIIVSNTSHMRRALKMATDMGMQASGAAAPMAANNSYLTIKQYLREGAAMVALFAVPK